MDWNCVLVGSHSACVGGPYWSLKNEKQGCSDGNVVVIRMWGDAECESGCVLGVNCGP
jgi:hypothetical protein